MKMQRGGEVTEPSPCKDSSFAELLTLTSKKKAVHAIVEAIPVWRELCD